MKKHWFNLCFIEFNDGKMTYGNSYTSNDERSLNMVQINSCKAFARVGNEAVLLSCSYLGFMTKENFTEGTE